MPRVIIKTSRDEDMYLEWSTVSDAPTFSGTRSELVEAGVEEDRLLRADESGSSAHSPFFKWSDPILIVQDAWGKRGYGIIQRKNLSRLASQLDSKDPLEGIWEKIKDDKE
jgi:hypothetical protein